MDWQNPPDAEIRGLLASTRTIAVVGCSPDPSRTSHQIAAQLQRRGYRVIPLHPAGGTILGERVYSDLALVPPGIDIDIVDVFRRPEATPEIAQAAVRARARCLWLQQGVINTEAFQIAREGGLICVMDLCLGVTQRILLGGGHRVREGT
jgi:uncharacterized protein